MTFAGIILSVSVLLLSIPSLADQVLLKNGDRLTGSISKSDGKVLVIKTDYAGDITVKFDAIQSITSAGDLNVGIGAKIVVGTVTTRNDDVVIETKTLGAVETPKASITMLRSPAEQQIYEKTQHPGLLGGWNGGLNIGFAVTRGNSETKDLNIAFNSMRKGLHDKLTLYTNSIYATNDLSAANPHTTSNSVGGGARYDHDFSARTFGFGNVDFFSNELQYLNLRSTLGGGVGVHIIKNAATTFDFLVGANYTHENYDTRTDSLGALTLGDSFTRKAGKSTVITQSFFFYPDLSDTSQYRGTFNFGTVTKINKWLGWQNSLADIYVSNPPPAPAGSPAPKKNDLQLATGVTFTFTH